MSHHLGLKLQTGLTVFDSSAEMRAAAKLQVLSLAN